MSLPSAPTQVAVNTQPPREAEMHLRGRWLALARVALLAISALALVVYIAGIPANLAWFNSFHTDCQDVCMTPATVQSLHALDLPITAFAVYWTSGNLL